MFDPRYNNYQNNSMNQNMNSFGQNVNMPYIRGVTTHMPQPMPGNISETDLYPLQSSLATPQLDVPIQSGIQTYAEGGMVKKSKKGKKEKMNPYPSLAEMIRLQGKGEDTILAHINPLEAMMLKQMGGSGDINPSTGLPQFGLLKSLGKALTNIAFKPISLITNSITGPKSRINHNPTIENAIVPAAPVNNRMGMVPAPQKFANEELLEKLRNKIYTDQAGLSNTNYVPYTGEVVAPTSPYTQRAQDLKDQWAKNPSPYAKKIDTVLKRDIQGFSPEQQQNLLGMLRRGTTSEDLATQRLQKQFGNNYGYESDREARMRGKVGKDLNRSLTNSGANIKNLSDELALMEGNRRTDTVRGFHNAGLAKEGRRNALTNQLEEFGNQDRNFRNLKNQANRDTFDEERLAPYRRIAAANQGLQQVSPYVSGRFEEMHPDKAAVNNAQLQKIMNNYNMPYNPYPGKRVVDIDPNTQTGYNLTQQMSPKYRDKFHGQRKELERGFLNNPNIATQTYNKIPEGLEPLMANLDYLTKQQLKQETRNISGKHRRIGSYGSGPHKVETERAMRDILRRVQAEREGSLLTVGKTQAALANENEQNNLRRYGQMSALGAKEFGDVLAGHRNMVNSGNRRWANNQALENERLQSWYDQLNHESPVSDNNQMTRKYIMPI